MGGSKLSDKFTLVVMKDLLASRAFQFRLAWIYQVGFCLGLAVFLALVGCVYAFKYYRLEARMHPLRIGDLEWELADLKAALKKSQEVSAPVGIKLPFFGAFGRTEVAPSQLEIVNFQTSLTKNTLSMTLGLQTNEKDRYQGTILILARGSHILLTYPPVLFPAGQPFLFDPQQGEPFSMTHYRTVKAEFLAASSQDIKTIEVFIFQQYDGKLLAYRSFPLQEKS